MKFDTRDKKPKLWNIAILSCITALIVFFMKTTATTARPLNICLVLDLYFLMVIVFLLMGFYKQLQYNPYSYNTIIYMGFALFVFSVLITHAVLTVRICRYPDIYTEKQILRTLLFSAKNYMVLSLPFIAVYSAALCTTNISLIRHEGKRFVNILGILLSFMLMAGEGILLAYDNLTASFMPERSRMLIGNLYAAVYLYFECMLIGTIIANAITSRHEPDPDKDYLIILGCGIRKDGTPSPLLKGRIDRALEFRNRQKQETGKDLIFVTSGGQGPDEVISESACMKNYLIEQGIPETQIIEEDRSTTTFENMKFSKEKILESGRNGKIAFATNGYHVFRSGLFARRVKMRAIGMGAPTKWYFWPNAAVREFIGLLTQHRGKQLLIFGGMLAVYSALTLMLY